MSKTLDDLVYKVAKVTPLSNSLNIPENLNFSSKTHKIAGKIKLKIEAEIENNLIAVFTDVEMVCHENESDVELGPLFSLTSKCEYKVENLDKYLSNEEEPEVDKSILRFFVEISLDQTRGMQSVYLKGSPISKYIMPRVDIDQYL